MGRRWITDSEFEELVKKILDCPHIWFSMSGSEAKHVRPILKKEIEAVLKEYFTIHQD